jgi:arylsulfatase A-like enzyme
MRDKSSSSFREVALAACAGAFFAGAVDGMEVVQSQRLGLGFVGAAALIGGGGVAAMLPGAIAGLLLAPWATRRRDGWFLGGLGGAGLVLAARAALAAQAVGGLGEVETAAVGAVVWFGLLALAAGYTGGHSRAARPIAAGLVAAGLGWVLFSSVSAPLARPSGLEHPNVLLVTIASARFDRFGGTALDTPAWDQVVADGTAFDLAWSPSPQTAVAARALLAGRGPWEAPADQPETLTRALVGRGYAAGAVVGADSLAHDGVLDEGFHVYDDDHTWPKGLYRTLPGRLWVRSGRAVAPTSRRADEVVDRAVRFVAGRSGRWFCWVHLDDPTAPYTPPVPHDERHYPGGDPRDPALRGVGLSSRLDPAHGRHFEGITDPAYVQARYDGEIDWTDSQLGRLLQAVDELGWGPTTLVAVVGLHGEGLREGELWFGRAGDLRESLLHVPVALRLPGRIPIAQRVRSPIELSDLASTLLDYVGDEGVLSGAAGVSLRPTLEGQGVARTSARAVRAGEAGVQVAIRERGVLLVHQPGEPPTVQRFPQEEELREPWTEARLLGLIDRAVALDGTGAAPPTALDPQGLVLLEALRSGR